MSLWTALLLGLSAGVMGQPSGQTPAKPPAATQQATSQPQQPPINPPSAPAPEQLDELRDLIIGENAPQARKLGATKLLEAGTPEAIQRLAGILLNQPGKPEKPAAKIAVCQAILEKAECPTPMRALAEPLIALLGDDRPGMDEAVVRALGRFENGEVVKRLRSLVAESTHEPRRRTAAIRALGEMGDNMDAVEVLVPLAGDPNADVRESALSALETATGIRHADASAAQAWWTGHRSMTRMDWLHWRNERLTDANHRMQRQTLVLTQRLVAARREAYLQTPEPDRPALLLSFLQDELTDLRALGLDLINVLITDRKEVGPPIKSRLVEMLTDPDADIRLAAAVIVRDLRLAGSLSVLTERIGQETDNRVRAALVGAVGRLDDPAAVPALIERLVDDASLVVGEAALALGAIARRGHGPPEVAEQVAAALSEQFGRVGGQNEALREQFLIAMASMASPAFEPMFLTEAEEGRSIRIRRAAVAGLATVGTEAATARLRELVPDSSPEVRLAAAAALGQCGRAEKDLAALTNRLDNGNEPDQAVREQAWESLLAIAQRQPAQEQVSISDQFAQPHDPTAQRRRLALLRALQASPERYEKLKPERRLGVLERIADAQMVLGDWKMAASTYEQAMDLMPDAAGPRQAALAEGAITALLRGNDDAAALSRIDEWTQGERRLEMAGFAEAVVQEVERRVSAAAFADALSLLADARRFAERAGPAFSQRLAAMEAEATKKRDESIGRLLSSILTDSTAEARLLAYGPAVLRPLHARLTALPTTTGPAAGMEAHLVALAKRLAPDWPGFAPGCPPEERKAALAKLEARWAPETPPAPPTTTPSPTSAPAS